jgi:hypothetical protein
VSEPVTQNSLKWRIGLLPTPADLLTKMFDDILPGFTLRVIQGRQELNRCGSRPVESPIDILIECARDQRERVYSAKDDAAITKGAPGEDVSVE